MESSEQKVHYKNLDTAEYKQIPVESVIAGIIIFVLSGGLIHLVMDTWVTALLPLLITVAIGWFLYRMKSSWLLVEWHTSPDGLDRRDLISRKHFAWSDVTVAKSGGMNHNSSFNLKLKIGKKWINLEGMPSYFVVSIWQHLERHGKTKTIISENFQRLWLPLPDDLYSETEWYNPYPPSMIKSAMIATIGTILAISARLHYDMKSVYNNIWSGPLMCAFVMCFMGYFWYKLHMARRMWLFPDRLQTESARGQITFLWDKVTNARILKDKLIIWESWSKLIVIPFDNEDKDSMKFIYSVINRLRSAERPVLVPVPVYLNPEKG